MGAVHLAVEAGVARITLEAPPMNPLDRGMVTRLGELLDQVAVCTTRGHRIHIKVGRGFVVRAGPNIDWHSPQVSVP